MDTELFELIPQIINASSNAESNAILLDWIEGLEEITDIMEDEGYPDPQYVKLYPYFSWITEDVLGAALLEEVEKVRMAYRSYQTHRYYDIVYDIVAFKGENAYATMSYSNLNYRLLGLFRYWNMIQYFFPYRNLFDEDWHEVLNNFIPLFIAGDTEYDYKYNILALITKIGDSHANVWNYQRVLQPILKYGTEYFDTVVTVKFVEGKAIVAGFKNEALGLATGLIPGDIIETVDGKRVDEIVEELLPVTSASNYPTQLRIIAQKLLLSLNNTVKVSYRRDNKVYEAELNTYDRTSFPDVTIPIRTVDDNISLIYPGTITIDLLDEAIPDIMNSKGIIVDMRCYPNETIIFPLGRHLMPESSPFVKFSRTQYIFPGVFTYLPTYILGYYNFDYYTEITDYYKGKTVVIVNEETQSEAEFTTMAYQASPNTIVIGSTTAAADGNMVYFYLPGNIYTAFSGLGVYYPDGTETQRVGIVPNVEVLPTIEGIKNGIDEPLQKAIDIINEGTRINDLATTDEFSLYADPNGMLHIRNIPTNGEINLFDLQGKKIVTAKVHRGDNSIDTQN